VNCGLDVNVAVPFGGYKQSGIGRELGQYALDTYVLYFLDEVVFWLTDILTGILKSKEFTLEWPELPYSYGTL
jgi:acyl-CoA reductase-like NAD-dependent aldehyde dehydrogenase